MFERLERIAESLEAIEMRLTDLSSPHVVDWTVAIVAIVAAVAAAVSAVQARRAVAGQETATKETLTAQREMNDAALVEQRRAAILPVLAQATAKAVESFDRLGLALRSVSAQEASPRAGGDAQRWAHAAEAAFDLATSLMKVAVVMPVANHADYLRQVAAYLNRVAITCAHEAEVPDEPPSVANIQRLLFIQQQYGSYGVLTGKWTENVQRAVAIYARELDLLARLYLHDGEQAARDHEPGHPKEAAAQIPEGM